MNLSLGKKIKLIVAAQIIAVANALGFVFVVLRFGFDGWMYFINAIIISTLAGIIISIVEFSFMLEYSKKMKFHGQLLTKFLIYAISFILILFNVSVISRIFITGRSYLEIVNTGSFRDYLYDGTFLVEVIYMLAFTFIIDFTIMLNRKLGPGMMMSFIKGTYYTPRTQVRVVIFIKVKNSADVLKQLKPVKFHSYLNRVFLDITIPVMLNDGIIHEYIDDLIVVTWHLKDNLKLNTCFNLFFEVQERLERHKEDYLAEYNVAPEVCAGLHIGSLVASEIGEIKTQIALLGDTLNTTARIQQKCEELSCGLLASRDIVSMAKLLHQYEKKPVGYMPLKGKQEKVELFEIVAASGER